MSGSFDVELDDGSCRKRLQLNRSDYDLYVAPMIWREIDNFSSGSVCMVFASDLFDESGYYRHYDEFVIAARRHDCVSYFESNGTWPFSTLAKEHGIHD